MINIIENDFKKLLNQEENICLFQGRYFHENVAENSSMLSIYIGVNKKKDI